MSASETERNVNRLAQEKSPYLLQHAANPVDWYPWGEAAFQKARKENKPIFLSIGYSTCHWCHVMERESFSDPDIAEVMNKHFVCIKVDREERPDIDKIYMMAATGAGWGGGWPLSVWLTPELKPFFGGTYFPPESRWGQPGFRQVLERISELWGKNRDALTRDADRLVEALAQYAVPQSRAMALDPAWLDNAYRDFVAGFDASHGGFNPAPKFPMPVNQNFLLRYWARTGEKKALEMALKTLGEMAQGGIYDHVGGGFHRYSTDGEWRVPHFEKMLYDNAQLAINYLEAYQAGKDKSFAEVARRTLQYVRKEMTHPEGGFYSAQDADSIPPEASLKASRGDAHKSEGAFYLWTESELRRLLGPEFEIFAFRYGVRPNGNALQDPHGEFTGKNILYAEHTLEESAQKFSKTPGETSRLLRQALEKLYAARARRPHPSLDDKVLTSWNGLMISAFAKGSQVLEEPDYLSAAQKAARFIRSKLYDPKSRRLYHRFRDGERSVLAMAEDYAFLLQGLLDLYEAGFDPKWLDWSVELSEDLIRLFYDPAQGGFYMTAQESKNLLVRVLEDYDNVEPSASSVAALNLLRLAQFTNRDDFRKAAEKTLSRFAEAMRERPRSLPQMLCAADFAASKPRQILIAGDLENPLTQEMLRAVHARYLPVKILMLVPPGEEKSQLTKHLPFLQGVAPIQGKPTAYICVNYACKLPTSDLQVVSHILDGEKL